MIAHVEELELALEELEGGQIRHGSRLQGPQLIVAADGRGRRAGGLAHHRGQVHSQIQQLGGGLGQALDRTFETVGVEIGADDVCGESLGQRLLGHLVVKAAAAVTQVEEHALLPRLPGLGDHPAVRAQDGVAMALVAVGGDIARPQERQHLGQGHARADVHHDRSAGQLGGFHGQAQWLDPVLPYLRAALAHLDAHAGFRPVVDHKSGTLGISVAQILHLGQRPEAQAGAGDVHKGEDLGARRLDNVLLEAREVDPARAAGVHDRGHPGGQTERVGFDAPGGDAGVHVGVDVHPAGGENLAGQIEALAGRLDDPLGHGHDRPLVDGHVPHPVQVLRRVHHGGARQDQIVWHGISSLSSLMFGRIPGRLSRFLPGHRGIHHSLDTSSRYSVIVATSTLRGYPESRSVGPTPSLAAGRSPDWAFRIASETQRICA